MGKGQGPDWERSSAAWVSAGVRTARTSQGVTRGPATRAETLTCTEWTGPLGLKQRRHQVNFCRIQKPPCQASEELPLPQEQKVSAAALAEGPARRPASTRPMPHSDRCQCRWASAPPLPPPLRELSLPTRTARPPPPPPGNHLQESPSPESSPGVCCTEGGGEACPVTLTLGAGAVEVRPGNISEAAGCGPGRPGWGTGPPLPRGVCGPQTRARAPGAPASSRDGETSTRARRQQCGVWHVGVLSELVQGQLGRNANMSESQLLTGVWDNLGL